MPKFMEKLGLTDAISTLSKHRRYFRPAGLDEAIFPSDLDVLSFKSAEILKIRTRTSAATRIFEALFCLPHYLIFPGMFLGGFVLTPMIGGAGPTIALGLGLSLWIWRNWLGRYLSIDLVNERYALVGPGFYRRYEGWPDVDVSTWHDGRVWHTKLAIGDITVLERRSAGEPDNADLTRLANALNWHFGGLVNVGGGVFVTP